MSKKLKKSLLHILVATALFAAALLLPLAGGAKTAALLVVYALVGWDIVYKAVRNILHGQVFDENFLMTVATIGAIVLGDFAEAVAVMLFYQTGEWFQKFAVGRSRRSIAQLMDIRPDYANLLAGSEATQVEPEQVAVDDLILVKAGERVPLDGVVLEGASSLDTSALTGESAPKDVHIGDEIISGCINLSGTLTVRVTKPYGQSTVARILNLVENASGKKAKAENFITKFARYYTPAVCAAALALAVLPPLALGQAFGPWVYRALTFLVISCPCALVISIPLGFFAGIGGASKQGVLVKGSNYMEALAAADTVVFDKTGTLTQGVFGLSAVYAHHMPRQRLLQLAAGAESQSGHPIAQSIVKAYGAQAVGLQVKEVEERAGYGVQAVVNGTRVLAGNARMMEQAGIQYQQQLPPGTVVHVAADGVYAGYLLVEDRLKPDAAQAVAELKSLGVQKTVMLTGDTKAVGEQVAAKLGLSSVYTKLLPADKVERVEALLQAQKPGAKLAYVGDGINDAPVLARADVGIAMGGLGSDAAIEAADVVIMTDEPSKIPVAIRTSRKTLRIVKQNIVFALGVKALVLLLGALGFAGMWAAVFADVGVTILAILNAVRALRVPREGHIAAASGTAKHQSLAARGS